MLSTVTFASCLALAALSSSASAQDSPATAPSGPPNATSIALVEAQYNASGFDAPIGNSQSFNISLDAKALLEVVYGETTVENGAAYPADAVAQSPKISVYPTADSNISASDKFTLMLADASALGNPDPEGDYRHYLANNVHAPEGWTAEQLVFNPVNDTVITYYAGPGPLPNTGAHRYAWLLFQQPDSFQAPSELSNPGVAPSHWSVSSYVQESGLGELIAASFFTVENGAPSVSAVATSSINTATLEIPSTAASAAATGGSSSAASGVPAAGASPTASSEPTGAASAAFGLSGILGSLSAVAAAVVLLA